MSRPALLVATFLAATSAVAWANPPRGFILGDAGQKCWFNQTTTSASHLHTIPAQTGRAIFEDPACLWAEGELIRVNQRMVNNAVARWYGQSDASFATGVDELRPSSALQQRGQCMQSSRYPTLAVAIDYDIEPGKFKGFTHATAIQGCTD